MNRNILYGNLKFLFVTLFFLTVTNGFARVTPQIYTLKNNETVSITGQGFDKFEMVSLSVENYNKAWNQNTVLFQWNSYADAKGSFEISLPINSLNTNDRQFIIKATGENSKLETQTVFSAVTPIVVSGNPSCTTLNASSNPAFAHITTNYGFKIDPPASGTFTFTNGSGRQLTGGAPSDPSNSLSISSLTNKTFDWSSTKLISAVIVKGGSNANVYPYNPQDDKDKLLTTVGGGPDISHIEFCFENKPEPASITIIKDSQPNTTQDFKFSATGQVNNNFDLVDNGVVGPDRKTFSNLTSFGAGNSVTVTEGAPVGFYQLTQINCTSTVNNNNTITLPTRSVQIVLEPGENVTCTFVNTVVTAASTYVSGKVVSESGLPISRTLVTIRNLQTGETKRTLTGSWGYYRFEGLEVGNSYLVMVENRKFVFTPNSTAFTLNDAVDNLDFTGSNQ